MTIGGIYDFTSTTTTSSFLPARVAAATGAAMFVCVGEAVARRNAPDSALRPSTMLNNLTRAVSAFSVQTGVYGGKLTQVLFYDAFQIFCSACRVLVAPFDVFDGLAITLYESTKSRKDFSFAAKNWTIGGAIWYLFAFGVYCAIPKHHE